jgi:hypothetical protein
VARHTPASHKRDRVITTMGIKKSNKPRLAVVRFTKSQLMRLPKNERELLLRVGLLINDILLYQRLWLMLMYRDPKSALAKEAHAIQSATLLLALVGKTFEAMEVFDRRFLSSNLLLDQQRKSALSKLAGACNGELMKKWIDLRPILIDPLAVTCTSGAC